MEMIIRPTTDRWAGFCPECCGTQKEVVVSVAGVTEYECTTCGCHYCIDNNAEQQS